MLHQFDIFAGLPEIQLICNDVENIYVVASISSDIQAVFVGYYTSWVLHK